MIMHIYIYMVCLRTFTATSSSGHKDLVPASIGIILYTRSFYVNKVLQDIAGPVNKDRKGGATVAWATFSDDISRASCDGNYIFRSTYSLILTLGPSTRLQYTDLEYMPKSIATVP